MCPREDEGGVLAGAVCRRSKSGATGGSQLPSGIGEAMLLAPPLLPPSPSPPPLPSPATASPGLYPNLVGSSRVNLKAWSSGRPSKSASCF